MTNANINNPQAFPMHIEGLGFETGMTLRDYFAAKALTGYRANSFDDGSCKLYARSSSEEIAELCYNDADSMLKERMKVHDQHEER